jgi:hypothetical protein
MIHWINYWIMGIVGEEGDPIVTTERAAASACQRKNHR